MYLDGLLVQNDLLCEERDVKLYSLTASFDII